MNNKIIIFKYYLIITTQIINIGVVEYHPAFMKGYDFMKTDVKKLFQVYRRLNKNMDIIGSKIADDIYFIEQNSCVLKIDLREIAGRYYIELIGVVPNESNQMVLFLVNERGTIHGFRGDYKDPLVKYIKEEVIFKEGE